jgi:hypothetical protein
VPAPVPEEAVLDEAAAAEEEVVAEEAGAAEEISLPEGVTIILPDGTVLSGFETIIVRR